MGSSDGDKPYAFHRVVTRPTTKARAIEKTLSRLGEPITEAQARDIAAPEDCDCKDGMFALAATAAGCSLAQGPSVRRAFQCPLQIARSPPLLIDAP